jgi:hypothetical protein
MPGIFAKDVRGRAGGSDEDPTLESLENPHLDKVIAQYLKSPKTPRATQFSLYERSIRVSPTSTPKRKKR